jgi:hypothetical protein
MRDNATNAAEFWRQTEEELGEKILVYTMGEHYDARGPARPLFGLLFVSESALHFRHFAQHNWISSLAAPSRRSAVRSTPEDEISIRIPLAGSRLRIPPRAGWFSRVFGSGQFPVYTFEQFGTEGSDHLGATSDSTPAPKPATAEQPAVFRFRIQMNEDAFLKVLRDKVETVVQDEPE